MKVTVLGCGGTAGVPMLGGEVGMHTGIWGACDPKEPRNRRTLSSIVIEVADGFRWLGDSGPDLPTQRLACGFGRVEAVFYS